MSDPKTSKQVTIQGRLSFPVFGIDEAMVRSAKGQYPQTDKAKVSPDFQLLLSQSQWEKFLDHAVNTFLPYCAEQFKLGKDENDALDPKDVKQLIATIEGDLEMQTLNTPVKPIHEKTAALAPDAVVAVKCIGPKGGDIKQFAVVHKEEELKVPDADLIEYPALKPIGETVHELYPGCVALATVSLYSYYNGRNPGFSARATACVFKADADRFGGGGSDVDMDAVFMD